MLRKLVLLVVGAAGLSGTGCITMYPGDPNERMEIMLNQSEDYRQMAGVWRRFWFTDQPSHMTPERIHGGIGP